MYLVNALAFEAEWADVYEKHQIREGRFTLEDGTRQDVDMMHSQEYTYLEDDLATGFMKFYKDNRYAFVAMLPNEDVSVSQYVDSLTGEHLRSLLNNPQDITVYASMPKFEMEYDIEMSEVVVHRLLYVSNRGTRPSRCTRWFKTGSPPYSLWYDGTGQHIRQGL